MHDESGRADSGGTSGGGASGEAQSEALRTVLFSKVHRTEKFVCSKSERVAGFFTKEAPTLLKYNYCRIFILADPDDEERILGYYTLSPAALRRALSSKQDQRKVPPGLPYH